MAKGHIAPNAVMPCISWVGCESRKFNRVKQMLIDLTAFAESFSMYLCHLTAGIAADADNLFHIEDNIIREAYSNGEVFDVDLTAYHAALHKRDETHDNFTRSLRFYRQTTNSTLSDEEVDFLVHQKQQQWIVDNALHLSGTSSISLAYDATRDVWVERKIA